jgi:hypothetical protein
MDFSDPATNKRHNLLPYDFVVLQNGKDLFRKSGLSQAGSDVQELVFTRPGLVNIRVENVGENNESYAVFNSTVYENPNISPAEEARLQQSKSSNLPSDPFKVNTLTLVWITYIIIGIIPAAVAVVYVLYPKKIL